MGNDGSTVSAKAGMNLVEINRRREELERMAGLAIERLCREFEADTGVSIRGILVYATYHDGAVRVESINAGLYLDKPETQPPVERCGLCGKVLTARDMRWTGYPIREGQPTVTCNECHVDHAFLARRDELNGGKS